MTAEIVFNSGCVLTILSAIIVWAVGYGRLKQKVEDNEESTLAYIKNNTEKTKEDHKILLDLNWRFDKLCGEFKDNIHKIDMEVAKLSATVSPLIKIIDTSLIQMLKHPHTPRFDDLIDKFNNGITHDELTELRYFINEEIDVLKTNGDVNKILIAGLALGSIDSKLKTFQE